MKKILIVDDIELNRELLSLIFEEDYEIIFSCDGEEACNVIDREKSNLSLIFLDLIMPKKTGLDVLAHLRFMNLIESIPVIMITGEATDETDVKAYEFGAADIIYKPFNAKVVKQRATNLIEQYEYRKNLEDELEIKIATERKNQIRMAKFNDVLLNALGSIVEFRNLESGLHVKRVMGFTEILLNYIKSYYPEYGLTNDSIEKMAQAAALHDVGKIGIPDSILNAPRRLTKEEFDVIKTHTVIGDEIIKKFGIEGELFKYCREIARWHHEKVDGRGYPDGLVGKDIPIYCQATSVADCFDALITKRVYKGEVECEEAFNMIVRGECGAFSDEMMNCFSLAKNDLFKLAVANKNEEQ